MSICAFQTIVENELNSWPYFLFIVGKYLILPLEDGVYLPEKDIVLFSILSNSLLEAICVPFTFKDKFH